MPPKKSSAKKSSSRSRKKPTPAKTVAKIAKQVVINNQEMLRRSTGIKDLSYLDGNKKDGPFDTVFKGLNTRGPLNFVLNPLNYGWENDQSSEGGITEKDHFTGRGIHPRYLKTRMKFEFPRGEHGIIDPMRIQLVWGFVKRPALLTPYTTPKSAEVTRNELIEMFMNQVEPNFDSPADQLAFRVKKPNNYIITGKRWLKPDRRHRIGAPQQWAITAGGANPSSLLGAPPDIVETISWKMGKEWRLQRTEAETDDPLVKDVFWYNNEQWAPFFLVFSPDYCNVTQATGEECGGGEEGEPVPEENRIKLQHNSCMWYTDA